MNYLLFKDISHYQGNYDMASNSDPIIVIKMSGGDDGLYYDSQAAANYNKAVVGGKAVGMYHFAGGQDPIAEADYFVGACSPLAENDVLILDWEIQHDSPVDWVRAFCSRVYDRTGVWPWIYMNMSTANSYDWSSVFNNCGFWCAAPSYGFDDVLPVKYACIAQQGPVVNREDTDAFFGTLDQFKAYGYHVHNDPVPPPTPPEAPEPTSPAPTPSESAPTPAPTPPPVESGDSSSPSPSPEPTPSPSKPSNQTSFWQKLLALLRALIGLK